MQDYIKEYKHLISIIKRYIYDNKKLSTYTISVINSCDFYFLNFGKNKRDEILKYANTLPDKQRNKWLNLLMRRTIDIKRYTDLEYTGLGGSVFYVHFTSIYKNKRKLIDELCLKFNLILLENKYFEKTVFVLRIPDLNKSLVLANLYGLD